MKTQRLLSSRHQQQQNLVNSHPLYLVTKQIQGPLQQQIVSVQIDIAYLDLSVSLPWPPSFVEIT